MRPPCPALLRASAPTAWLIWPPKPTSTARSTVRPSFIQTNVIGTQVLLAKALAYWRRLTGLARDAFRFLHVSTDEVFGSFGGEGSFNEATPYDPRSPYSASKAAADHLVRAWGHTFGLPVVISNCSNNYLMLVSTLVRAHQQATTGRGSGSKRGASIRLWGVPEAD